MTSVSVVGLGKLGACMAACMAAKGIRVVGVDINEETVAAMRHGQAPTYEPGLAELLATVKPANLMVTTDIAAIAETDTTFIVVPTPSEPNGAFSLRYVKEAAQNIGRVLRDKPGYHVVAVTSTVLPGSTEYGILPILERESGKKLGDFGLCYNPEFIALGTVIRDFLNPDFVLIGESDQFAGAQVARIYGQVCKSDQSHWTPSQPMVHMSIPSAELAKIAINGFVTTKIAYANMLSDLCEKTPGANVDDVTRALGMDRRIGPKYLKAGMGYGGPCVPTGTLVQTANGLVPIEAITEGGTVLAHDGRYHKVTRTYRRHYEGELVRVVAEGFPADPILATPEHPVWSAPRISHSQARERVIATTGKRRLNYMVGAGPLTFRPIRDLIIGDILGLPRPLVSGTVPSMALETHHLSRVPALTRLTPDLMYTFGWFVAEGSTFGKDIKLSVHAREEHYITEIGDIWQKSFGAATRVHWRTGNGIASRTTCAPLARYLRGTFGHRCDEKQIPAPWIHMPEPHLRALLRGMWYGDGSRAGGRYTWATVSPQLFNFMKLALLRLGIPFTTKKYRARVGADGVGHRPAFFLTVANPSAYPLMAELLPDLALPANGKGKRTVFWRDGAMLYHIRKIDRVHYSGDVHNLEVEGAESYVLEGGTVHNCFPRDNVALAAFGKSVHAWMDIPRATDHANRYRLVHLADQIALSVANNTVVAILGMSYKPGTAVIDESPGLELARKLSAVLQVTVFDPIAMAAAKAELGNRVAYAESVAECVRDAHVIVVANPDSTFTDLGDCTGKTVIDPWRIVTNHFWVDYRPFGIGAADDATEARLRKMWS